MQDKGSSWHLVSRHSFKHLSNCLQIKGLVNGINFHLPSEPCSHLFPVFPIQFNRLTLCMTYFPDRTKNAGEERAGTCKLILRGEGAGGGRGLGLCTEFLAFSTEGQRSRYGGGIKGGKWLSSISLSCRNYKFSPVPKTC